MNLDQSKVDALILEYETQGPHELTRLMDMQRQLSSQAYWYSQLLGDVSKQYRSARVQRKSQFALMVARSTQTSNAAKVAEVEAREDYRELYRQEYELDGRREAGRIQTNAIGKVLDAMKQDIAELRQEKKDAMNNQGVYS